MSKVIRLSDKEIEMLEEYRKFKISQLKKMSVDFPALEREISIYENDSIEDLLFSALSSACFWEEKNDNNMR